MKFKKSLFEMTMKRKKTLSVQMECNKNIVSSHPMKRPITMQKMEWYLNGIRGTDTINEVGISLFQTYKDFKEDMSDNPSAIDKTAKFYINEIIPRYKNLQEVSDYLKRELKDDTYMMQVVDEYCQCDRVLRNQEKLNRRFNLNRFLESERNIETAIQTLCEFIDTYGYEPDIKYNLAIENIPYTLYENGIRNIDEQVYDTITEYFLLRNDILTDSYMRKLSNVTNKSKFLTENTKFDLNRKYFLNKNYFGEKVDQFMKSKHMDRITNINSEKKAHDEINAIVKEMNRIDEIEFGNKKALEEAFDFACSIPYMGLAINIPEPFIEVQLLNQINLSKNPYVKDVLQETLNHLQRDGLRYFANRIETIFENDAIVLNETNDWKNRIGVKVKDIKDKVIGKPDSGEQDFKILMKNFKAEQNKDATKFKILLNKLYTKTPMEILDETPHVLGLVRSAFIFSAVFVPVIGPVLMVVNAFIDRLLEMHLDAKQTDALYKYIKNEKKIVEEKLDTVKDTDTKTKLQKYDKVLETNLKKVKEYKEKEYDEILPNDSDSNDDFDLDDDLNFDLESVIDNKPYKSMVYESDDIADKESVYFADLNYYIESLNVIFEWMEKDRMNKLLPYQKNFITLENLGYIAPMVLPCKNSINYEAFCDMILSKYDPISMEYDKANKILYGNKTLYESYGTMRDILIERECLDTLNTVIMEGFKLNDLKLAFQSLKSKIKDLSAKEKQVSQTINMYANTFINSMEKAMRSDRREAIIKGSMIPSFSKCIKIGISLGGITLLNPVLGLISAFGYFACSKALNHRERQLIYDEIDTELKVVEKEISIAENDNDMKRYRFLLNYQKKLQRERQRIRYNLKVNGRPIPSAEPINKED